jgi:hypothetical protein
MPRNLCPLPRSEMRIKLMAELRDLLTNPLELHLSTGAIRQMAQFVHLFLEAIDLALPVARFWSRRLTFVFMCH